MSFGPKASWIHFEAARFLLGGRVQQNIKRVLQCCPHRSINGTGPLHSVRIVLKQGNTTALENPQVWLTANAGSTLQKKSFLFRRAGTEEVL